MSRLLQYQPVWGEDLVDREGIIGRLVIFLRREVGEGMLFRLIAPRRLGKTSILEEVCRRLKQYPKDGKAIPIRIDVSELLRKKDFAQFPFSYFQAFVAEYFNYELEPDEPLIWHATGVFDVLKGIAEERGYKGVALIASWIEREMADGEYVSAASHAVEAPRLVGEREDKNFVIFLDEMQDIVRVNEWAGGGDLRGVLRSSFESPKNCVLYVFSGSAVRLMENRIFNGSSPLWGRVSEEPLDPFTARYSVELAEKAAEQLRLTWESERVKDLVHPLCHGYPFYIIALMNQVARKEPGAVITTKTLEDSFVRALLRGGEIHKELFQQTREHLRRIDGGRVSPRLLAVAVEKDPASLEDMQAIEGFDDEVLEKLYMADIVELNPVWRDAWVADPVYKQWLREVYVPLFVHRAPGTVAESGLRQTIGRLVNDIGRLFETKIEGLMWTFAGQKVNGRYFGYPEQEIELPRLGDVYPRFRFTVEETGEESEIDLVGRVHAAHEGWLVEAKYQERELTPQEVTEFRRKAEAFVELYDSLYETKVMWLCTRRPLSDEVKALARQEGMLFSTEAELDELWQMLRRQKR